MKKNPYCILIIFFLLPALSQPGVSQAVFPVGLELGITFSQFTTKNTVSEYWETRTTTVKPLYGPLIGISKDWMLTKHIRFSSGLQYQMAGKRSYTYADPTLTTSYSKEWENLTMHKLCLPLKLGFVFKPGKLSPVLYLGVRPNFILSGFTSYRYHGIIVYEDRDESIDSDSKQKLFDKNEYFVPPKRIFNQLTIGLSTPVGQHIRIDLNFNAGHNYYKNIFISRGNHSTYTWSEKKSIPGRDYVISVQYILNSIKPARNTDNETNR